MLKKCQEPSCRKNVSLPRRKYCSNVCAYNFIKKQRRAPVTSGMCKQCLKKIIVPLRRVYCSLECNIAYNASVIKAYYLAHKAPPKTYMCICCVPPKPLVKGRKYCPGNEWMAKGFKDYQGGIK